MIDPHHEASDLVYAWHFLRADRRLGYGDERLVEPGETVSYEDEAVLCYRGMHASEDISDALTYAPGHVICRVAVWGGVVHGCDKLVGQHRRCLWMIDATDILRLHACACAEWALEQELAAGREVDPRSYECIQAVRNDVAGCEVDLPAAESAARSAMSAAWAAESAARSAMSAESAAWAAESAAWAAESAARSASRAVWAARSASRAVFSSYLEDAAIEQAKAEGVWVPDGGGL